MRPELLCGETHKLKFTNSDGVELSFYVTVNLDGDKPVEVFVNVRDATYWEHLVAVTVGISRQLQAGIPVGTIAADLKQIHSPKTGHMMKGGWSPSIYARIGDILNRYKAEPATLPHQLD